MSINFISQRLGGKPAPWEGGLTRYISTRGEAPTLGFCDVMLTGLARDGGLYVPESWPQLSPDTIAGFFGRPYWEVAVEVIGPFVAGELSEADLGRMANEAYATFRHPAVVPLNQIGPHQFLLELFHGPTLAFKDVAMQLISRLMDYVLAKRAQRTTIVVATSGDTGGAAVDAFAGLDNVDLVVLFPHGRISEVQRRMMTTAAAANVHALAIEGTFDDCQALVKALFNHHSFRDAVSLSGVNSINCARIVAQVAYYFTSAVARAAPARTADFTVPPGNLDAGRADETETSAAIRAAWREIGDLVDPHTAVALAVADRDMSDSRTPNIVLSTAHPSKFPDAVEAACGVRPELPAWLEGLMSKPEHIKVMKNDQVEVERFVLSVSRAAKQGVAG